MLFLPVLWGLLSILVFVGIKRFIPSIPKGFTPVWIWLWLFQMILFIPVWKKLLNDYPGDELRNSLKIKTLKIPFGSPKFYLFIAYLAVLPSIYFYDDWYGKWFVFGGLVSPIFEEIFSRYLLSPFFKEKFYKFLLAAILSLICFSLMHWGFGGGSVFYLDGPQQFQKFIGHFIFGFVLCLIFRFSKSIQLVIWIHIAENLKFIITKMG